MSLPKTDSAFNLMQDNTEPNKVIADYVERNQSRLRSLLKDMSSRRIGTSAERQKNNQTDLAHSYLKHYGTRSSSIQKVDDQGSLASRMVLDSATPRKIPFMPPFGTEITSPVYHNGG